MFFNKAMAYTGALLIAANVLLLFLTLPMKPAGMVLKFYLKQHQQRFAAICENP
jgi:hypothetical protein